MGRELPQRASRGKRVRDLLDEEAEADQQFWQQEFFAEEQEDVDYQESEEEADIVDSDFDEPEDDEDDDEVEGDEDRPRKKTLKPPGAPKAAKPKPLTAEQAAEKAAAKAEKAAKKAAAADKAGEGAEQGPKGFVANYEAPKLRRSTLARVEEAEKQREKVEQSRVGRKKPVKDAEAWRPLTQEELLAEAARTEVENIASLKMLLAQEEEVRRKAVIIKQQHMGPTIRYHSKKEGDVAVTRFELLNMQQPPRWLQRSRAPPPCPRSHCVVTGLPAKYRDPASGETYASLAAYQKRRGGSPMPSSLAIKQQQQGMMGAGSVLQKQLSGGMAEAALQGQGRGLLQRQGLAGGMGAMQPRGSMDADMAAMAMMQQQQGGSLGSMDMMGQMGMGLLPWEQQQMGLAGLAGDQAGVNGANEFGLLSEEGEEAPILIKGQRTRRSRPSSKAGQIAAALTQQDTPLSPASAAGSAYDLPPDLMALVVDLHNSMCPSMSLPVT